MKKVLQLMSIFIFVAFVGNIAVAQTIQHNPKGPVQVSLDNKDADLLWGDNWEDPSETTSGIVSTDFGARPDPRLTLSADDFEVPEGETWEITEVWARGFLSADQDTGEIFADADGFGFRLYDCGGGQPGDLLQDVMIESDDFDPELVEIVLEETIELGAGTYWIGVYGYFADSSESVEGRWNAYTWNPDPEVLNRAMLNDYTDLFGMAASGWMILMDDLDIDVTALDFAIWGNVADDNDDPDMYEVTFNVDMSTAEGFDPDEHHVFVTGTFTGWAEPGTEGSLELEWAGKSRTVETIMYENFDGGEIPEGWLNLDENGDGYNWNIVTEPGHAPYDGDYAVISQSWDGTPLEPDNWLITHQLTNVTDDWELSFFVKAQDGDWPEENYDVLISTTGTDTGDFTSIYNEVLEDDEWEQITLSLAEFAGEDIYIAFRHHDVTDMFQIVIDAIRVEGTPGEDDNDDPDDLIYTGVAQVEAGTLEYKYFSDAIDEGWDGGEWEGDPNRSVEIDGDTVLNDVWGEYDDVSIVDAELLELSIYPNPASSVIHVEADNSMHKIQVYDVSGRMVMQMDVQDTYHSFDVSSLRNGFYIMQIHTEDGVEGRRFHVTR